MVVSYNIFGCPAGTSHLRFPMSGSMMLRSGEWDGRSRTFILCFLKLMTDWLGFLFRIIVLLACPNNGPCAASRLMSFNFPPVFFTGQCIHHSVTMDQKNSVCVTQMSPWHQWSITMFHRRDGVTFLIGHVDWSPNVVLIVAEKSSILIYFFQITLSQAFWHLSLCYLVYHMQNNMFAFL